MYFVLQTLQLDEQGCTSATISTAAEDMGRLERGKVEGLIYIHTKYATADSDMMAALIQAQRVALIMVKLVCRTSLNMHSRRSDSFRWTQVSQARLHLYHM